MAKNNKYFSDLRRSKTDRIMEIFERTNTISKSDLLSLIRQSNNEVFYKDMINDYKIEIRDSLKDVKSSISKLQNVTKGEVK